MFNTTPIETIDLKTIKLDIHHHQELCSSCLIIFNGIIDNAFIGGEVFNAILRHKEDGRNHILMDCNKLTYLAQSAGALAFHGIAKQIQKDGLKLVLLNKDDEHFHEEFKGFYSFVNIPDIEVHKYWHVVESIIYDDSLFVIGDVIFPSRFDCPICKTVTNVNKPGIIKCTKCNTIISINRKGIVHVE